MYYETCLWQIPHRHWQHSQRSQLHIKHNRNKNIKWKPYEYSLLRLRLFSDADIVLFTGNIN